MTFLASAPGAANAMDIVVLVTRQVVVEHMADVGNIETACGYIAADEKRDLAIAELVEGFHAALLVHVAMDGPCIEPMFYEGLQQDGNFDLAIAEDDGIAHAWTAKQFAEGFAFGPIFACWAIGEGLGNRLGRSGGRGDFDTDRVNQELLGKAGDFGRHGR